jgi:ketosteroid isomerase-like protein
VANVTSTAVNALDTVKRYYRLIDSGDLEAAFPIFAEDAAVRFGDRPPIEGREAIAAHIRGMVIPIARSVTHDVVRAWEVPGPDEATTAICEVVVTYTMRRSGNVIPHNAVTITEVDPVGRITAQRNLGDLGPVLADHEAHAG